MLPRFVGSHFREVLEGRDERCGEALVSRQHMTRLPRGFGPPDLLYIVKRPFSKNSSVAPTKKTPFDVDELHGFPDVSVEGGVGFFFHLHRFFVGGVGGVSQYVVQLLQKLERASWASWLWGNGSEWEVLSVRLCMWNVFSGGYDCHVVVDLRKGTVVEYRLPSPPLSGGGASVSREPSKVMNLQEWHRACNELHLSQLARSCSLDPIPMPWVVPGDIRADLVLVDDDDTIAETSSGHPLEVMAFLNQHAEDVVVALDSIACEWKQSLLGVTPLSVMSALVRCCCRQGHWRQVLKWLEDGPLFRQASLSPMVPLLQIAVLNDAFDVQSAMRIGTEQLHRSALDPAIILAQCRSMLQVQKVDPHCATLASRAVSILKEKANPSIPNNMVAEALLVQASALAAEGKLIACLELMNEAVEKWDSNGKALALRTASKQEPAVRSTAMLHASGLSDVQLVQAESFGSEISSLAGPKDVLGRFVTLSLEDSEPYLSTLLHYLRHGNGNAADLQQLLLKHRDAQKSGVVGETLQLHPHIWDMVTCVDAAWNARTHWIRPHEVAQQKGVRSAVQLTHRQWMQCCCCMLHCAMWDDCQYALAMAANSASSFRRNRFLWRCVMHICSVLAIQRQSVSPSLVTSNNNNNNNNEPTNRKPNAVHPMVEAVLGTAEACSDFPPDPVAVRALHMLKEKNLLTREVLKKEAPSLEKLVFE